MQLTPGQVREVLGLSPDTFRHWKHALPPLGGRNGYTPCFSPGDLLAMALIRTLTEDLGIRVGKLDELSTQLFEQCSEPWAVLERSILVIEPLSLRLTISPDWHPVALKELSISVPMRPVITGLRERLLLERPTSAQQPLRFPPAALGTARRSAKP